MNHSFMWVQYKISLMACGILIPAHQFALQQVALPCLRYMQELMAPVTAVPSTTSTDTEQSKENKVTVDLISDLMHILKYL